MKHVKFHLNRFLRRVRIHGGEFDTSARAMYRDEVVYPLQAEPRIVRGSTIERKQMSTKTTFKRVALVAVAALGLGVLSVAPSQAVSQADKLTISATTAAILTGETATVTLTGTFVNGAAANGDTLTVTASATALPDGAAVMPTLTASDTVNAAVTIPSALTAKIQGLAASTATSGKITVNVVIPAGGKVGTYAYKFTPTVETGSTLQGSAVTFTVTVTAAPADDTVVSAAKSTTWLSTGESVTSSSTTTSDSATVVAKTLAGTAQAATIEVVTKNAAGTTLATNPAVTVIVKSGTPGTVGSQAKATSSAMVSAGRAITTTAGDVIGVFSDGTEGVSEIEIYSGTILLATKKVTFYGAVASYGVTNAAKVIAVGGTGTLTVTGADKAANATAAPSVYATSSDTAVATVPTSAGSTITVTGVKSGKATITLCDTAACAAATITKTIEVLVGATTAKTVTITFDKTAPTAGEKVTATVKAVDASGNAVADGARLLLAAGGFVPSVTVSGSTIPTIETVTLSAGSVDYIFYAPAAGTVTFTATEGTATDSTTKGTITGSVTVSNPGLDAATAAGVAATAAATAATAAATAAGVAATAAADAAKAAADAATTAATTAGVSATAAADAATTAAEAAEAASQDATDAALDATTAAEAAGALAQEAVDAVAELSAEVTKLMAGVKAQITYLTKLVMRLAAK